MRIDGGITGVIGIRSRGLLAQKADKEVYASATLMRLIAGRAQASVAEWRLMVYMKHGSGSNISREINPMDTNYWYPLLSYNTFICLWDWVGYAYEIYLY